MAAVVLRSLRRATVIRGALNVAVAGLGAVLCALLFRRCGAREDVPLVLATVSAGLKVGSMVGAGIAQGVAASTIAARTIGGAMTEDDDEFRRLRKKQYNRWLWWTRFGTAVTVPQFVGAIYLMAVIVKDFSRGGNSKECFLGRGALVISFLVLVWLVVIVQCFTGSDVLRWRSFFATHDTAWKAYYREVFDHGIREALCCLGRLKYLSVLEEDEVYTVARLLGDLVAYRASGIGHLELLAGIAHLQKHKKAANLYGELMETPESRLQEAAALHQFAEAAYTGPLLDFGRSTCFCPCAWLYRQGMLTPWTRSRRPELEGDNWWRGHAAAFLKFVNLSPEALRKGRVFQAKCEAAYFIVVLHDRRSIVIAVRGTETPEDLLTDGLCMECSLTEEDLDGLINSDHVPPRVKQSVLCSSPHYGHSGIVESARELFVQIDGQLGDKGQLSNSFENSLLKMSGFLSSLLGVGCECHGYKVRIVGHSLGGAIATLLGLRLYRRYPSLHVYAYGTLPCVDPVLAEACSDFVTTIVYNDEFSARLSVNSILRLRDAAVTVLTDKSSSDSATTFKITRRTLHAKKCDQNGLNNRIPKQWPPQCTLTEGSKCIDMRNSLNNAIEGGVFLCSHAFCCVINMPIHHPRSHVMDRCKLSSASISEARSSSDGGAWICPDETAQPNEGLGQEIHEERSSIAHLDAVVLKEGVNKCINSELSEDGLCGYNSIYNGICSNSSGHFMKFGGQGCQSAGTSSLSKEVSAGKAAEMFLPGLVIHIVPEQSSSLPLWRCWRIYDGQHSYRAFVANRENFKDIIVTPSMFLDHLPWRCRYAMQRVLQTRKSQAQLDGADLNGEQTM